MNMRFKSLLSLLGALLLAGGAPAATLYVSEQGDDTAAGAGASWENAYRNIQTAIDAAADGDTVLVGDGTYYATATDDQSVVELAKGVTVRSVNGPSKTFIDAVTLNDAGQVTTRANRRPATLSHADATLSGFTLTNGTYQSKSFTSGVVASGGTLTNCTVHFKTLWAGYCLRFSGTARASDIRFHVIPEETPRGVSLYEFTSIAYFDGKSVLENSRITDQYWSVALIWPMMTIAGEATMRNCLVARNTYGDVAAANNGPLINLSQKGRIENCTIVDNEIRSDKGAVNVQSSGQGGLFNSIVCGNRSVLGAPGKADVYGKTELVGHSCSPCLVAGERGNLSVDPLLEGDDYLLSRVSRCIDAGLTPEGLPAEAVDLGGTPRVVGPAIDMGCHEYPVPLAEEGLACGFEPSTTTGPAPLAVTFSGYTLGQTDGLTALWDFGDGTTSTEWPTVTHVFTEAKAHTVKVTVENAAGEKATFEKRDCISVLPGVCYVATDGTPAYPYATWQTAARSIDEALTVGAPKIIVGKGTYLLPDLIILSTPTRIESAEGPAETILTTGIERPSNGAQYNKRFFTMSHDDAIVSGFTLDGGNSGDYGFAAVVEMTAGTLTNCVVRNIHRLDRSSAFVLKGTARVTGCTIDGSALKTGNGDSTSMGGFYMTEKAQLDHSRVYGFTFNCWRVNYGHGAVILNGPDAVVRDCLIHANTNGTSPAIETSGSGIILRDGTVENCTVVDNVGGGYGAGIRFMGAKGKVVNTIVHGNETLLGEPKNVWNDEAAGAITYSCAPELARVAGGLGEGCTTKDPRFSDSGDYSLTPISPCRDQGLNTAAVLGPDARDLAGAPRLVDGTVDMGCFELPHSDAPVPLQAVIDLDVVRGIVPFPVTATATVLGDTTGLLVEWDFDDGQTVPDTLTPTHTYTEPGYKDISVTLKNASGEECAVTLTNGVLALPVICYLSTNGTSVVPYSTWETAATNYDDAIALGTPEIHVGEGTYKIFGDGIVLNTPTKMKGVKGPAATILYGTPDDPKLTWQQRSGRLVWLNDDQAEISGFSLQRAYGKERGAAKAALISHGVLRDCIITNVSHVGHGPLVHLTGNGRMEDCLVFPRMSGYANYKDYFYCNTIIAEGESVIDRCLVEGYEMTAGISADKHSQAAMKVGGNATVRDTIVRDCMVVTNSAVNPDKYRAAVIVEGNGTLENCTIVGNRASHKGGGVLIASQLTENPVVRNNILWGNVAEAGAGNDLYDLNSPDKPRVSFSCLSDATPGSTGNLHVAPRFRADGVRLEQGSPCINAGTNAPWMVKALDFAGGPRILNRTVDMGAIERALPVGLLLQIR